MKSALCDGLFTGSTAEGLPFRGTVAEAMAYDAYEAETAASGTFPYHACANALFRWLPEGSGRVADLGCGTGISTLELLEGRPGYRAFAFDVSGGNIAVARYKFCQSVPGTELVSAMEGDGELASYWNAFRKRAEKYKGMVKFCVKDVEREYLPSIFDAAVASQLVHWAEDLDMMFAGIRDVLYPGGTAVWNTASHFCEDPDYPASEHGFRYNDFMGYVMDGLSEHYNVSDYRKLSLPGHTTESLEDVAETNGLKTKHVSNFWRKFPLRVFASNHVPRFARKLVQNPDGDVDRRIGEAISSAWETPAALADDRHCYEIDPNFRSTAA
jgi:SAM-dependent methyltransferase